MTRAARAGEPGRRVGLAVHLHARAAEAPDVERHPLQGDVAEAHRPAARGRCSAPTGCPLGCRPSGTRGSRCPSRDGVLDLLRIAVGDQLVDGLVVGHRLRDDGQQQRHHRDRHKHEQESSGHLSPSVVWVTLGSHWRAGPRSAARPAHRTGLTIDSPAGSGDRYGAPAGSASPCHASFTILLMWREGARRIGPAMRHRWSSRFSKGGLRHEGRAHCDLAARGRSGSDRPLAHSSTGANSMPPAGTAAWAHPHRGLADDSP